MTAPRLAPGRAFPPYAYTGDPQPHPVNDRRRHSFGAEPLPPPPLDPARWRASEDFLFGFDLFNHGYYWEAHEAWEGLWHAAGRAGPVAKLLQGLIKLAAAGVKARQGMADGVRRHAARAREHFGAARAALGGEAAAGLSWEELDGFAAAVEAAAARFASRQGAPRPQGPEIVFAATLAPSR